MKIFSLDLNYSDNESNDDSLLVSGDSNNIDSDRVYLLFANPSRSLILSLLVT